MTQAEMTAIAILRSGCSFQEAARVSMLTVEAVLALWKRLEAANAR